MLSQRAVGICFRTSRRIGCDVNVGALMYPLLTALSMTNDSPSSSPVAMVSRPGGQNVFDSSTALLRVGKSSMFLKAIQKYQILLSKCVSQDWSQLKVSTE